MAPELLLAARVSFALDPAPSEQIALSKSRIHGIDRNYAIRGQGRSSAYIAERLRTAGHLHQELLLFHPRGPPGRDLDENEAPLVAHANHVINNPPSNSLLRETYVR